MVETEAEDERYLYPHPVSVLYREPMWLKRPKSCALRQEHHVSVLYREPMWLKHHGATGAVAENRSFSALP
mgnify:CR=1 FL=1